MQSLRDALPVVVQAVTASIADAGQSISRSELQSALKCLEAWMSHLRGKYVPYRLLPATSILMTNRSVISRY